MDWIKKNPAQFSLGLVALLLAVSSVLLIFMAQGFNETFADIQGNVVKKSEIKALDTTALTNALASLKKSANWTIVSGSSSLFVSEKYIFKDGKLVRPGDPKGAPLHPPIPNQWFLDNGLDILSNTALDDDPDQDGFTNLEEWIGTGIETAPKSTDPNKADSMPPYRVKLFLKEAIKKPFRMVFMSRPDDDTAAINTLDLRQPTVFCKLGDMIKGTKFKIIKFEGKMEETQYGPKDASVLTLQNTETLEELLLPIEKQIDSPDSSAKFEFTWKGHEEFTVRKNAKFSLKSEPKVEYKLIDISANEALIQNAATGEQFKIGSRKEPATP
jgi:hypothetical protein